MRSRETRVKIKNSCFFCDFECPGATICGETRVKCQKLDDFCDFQCLLRLGEQDLILKLRQEDLPSKAASRRFAF